MRDVLVDTASGRLYSCGEDGAVKLWEMPRSTVSSTETQEMDVDEDEDGTDGREERKKRLKKEQKRQRKEEKKKAAMFSPY